MTNRRLFHLGPRLSIALFAATAAIATTAAVATPGSAQTGPTTLQLTGTVQKDAGFTPKHSPHPGDQLGFGAMMSTRTSLGPPSTT